MKKVFITGATGLLGSTIARTLLKKGFTVSALKRENSRMSLLGNEADQIEWIEGDVLDIICLEEAMQDITHVVHCAAMISFHPTDVAQMMQINVEGTANVMNAALSAEVGRVLHVSSVAAFGRPKGVSVIDENLDIKDSKDNFHYYRSKFLGEREAFRAHAEGLPVVIINPSTILGGGFWDMEPNKLFPQVADGYPFYTHGINGFVDVRDVCQVACRLLESEVSGEKFIVSSENQSFRDVMWKIADVLQSKRAFIPARKWMGEIAWRTEGIKSMLVGKKPFVTKEMVQIASSDFNYDNSKLREYLNFDYIPLDKTIQDTAQLYLQAKKANVGFSLSSIV